MSDAKAEALEAALKAANGPTVESMDDYIPGSAIKDAIDAYEAALESAGLVLVPRDALRPTTMMDLVSATPVTPEALIRLQGEFSDALARHVAGAMIAAAEPK